jgi:hypothetical protein
MKAKMSIATRLKLSELLSDQAGSYARLKVIRQIREELSLSDEEVTAIGFKENMLPDGRSTFTWDAAKDPAKECDVSEILVEVICKKLRDLDKAEKLTDAQMPLYEMFIELEEGIKTK